MEENKKSQNLSSINIIVLGHVDCGKSSTIGHLIYLTGGITQTEFEEFEKEAYERGKSSFKYAYLISQLKFENGSFFSYSFQTSNYSFTISDIYAFRDLMKTSIDGILRSDYVLLIISAARGEFEAGISKFGQTQHYISTSYLLGVKQLIICVNKMDDKAVLYSKKRYDEIKGEVSKVLIKVGYNPSYIPFIPISAYTGENLANKSSNMNWYDGPTLLETLDHIQSTSLLRPLRIPIQDVYRSESVLIGRVETGILRVRMEITFAPNMLKTSVESIEKENSNLTQATPGDTVSFKVQNVHGNICRGYVVGDSSNPPSEVESFVGQITILDDSNLISPGYVCNLCCHTFCGSCKLEKLISVRDLSSETLFQTVVPLSLKNGDCAVAQFIPSQPLAIERYVDYPSLGQFELRDRHKKMAIGVVTKVTLKNSLF